MYKKAAEFWAEIRVELLSASAFLSNEKPNSSQLWRLYWASHQVYELLGHWYQFNIVNIFGIHVTFFSFLSSIIQLLFVFSMWFCSVSLDICVCQLRCLLL